ncbi:MAG: hypothetical protein O6940_07510 [Ignavibacteria bacterium]|nr:hypothetical protein [Ignavibacteria bacterium]
MSPAERYEIVVDFGDANGSTIKLVSFNSEIESHIYTNGLSGTIYWISPILDDYDTTDFDILTFNFGDTTAITVIILNQDLT